MVINAAKRSPLWSFVSYFSPLVSCGTHVMHNKCVENTNGCCADLIFSARSGRFLTVIKLKGVQVKSLFLQFVSLALCCENKNKPLTNQIIRRHLRKCNSLYCRVDFEYINKQTTKHDIIHIGF